MADLMVRGIPDEVYRRLKDIAERNHRSLNGEVLARLERSVRPSAAPVEALLERAAGRGSRLNLPCLSEELLAELTDEGRP